MLKIALPDTENADKGRQPFLRANPFTSGDGNLEQLLTDKQQAELGTIATEVLLRARAPVYAAGSLAASIYIVQTGLVKVFRDLSNARQQVLAFLFPGDVFGLAENGRYVNSIETLMQTTIYEIPISAVTDMFRRDGDLELRFLYKVTHELREAQRHEIIITRRDAVGRVIMFLQMLERRDGANAERIEIPMSRKDVARYLGLSAEAVSRAIARLSRDGIVSFPRVHVALILNRPRFDQIALAA
jgi:CRP-like cAMP-binding protein